MKKCLRLIIVIVLLLVIIATICIFILNKKYNIKIKDEIFELDGYGMNSKNAISVHGSSLYRLEELTYEFYLKNYNYKLDFVDATKNEDGDGIISIYEIYDKENTKSIPDDIFKVSDDTGLAVDKKGNIINLEEAKMIYNISSLKYLFAKEELGAILYINSNVKDEFIKNSKDVKNVSLGEAYEFLLIPSNENVSISVNKCLIDDAGNISLGGSIIQNYKGNIRLSLGEFETVPLVFVTYSSDDSKISFPIMFSFKNRKLITQDEKIIDISIY